MDAGAKFELGVLKWIFIPVLAFLFAIAFGREALEIYGVRKECHEICTARGFEQSDVVHPSGRYRKLSNHSCYCLTEEEAAKKLWERDGPTVLLQPAK